MTSQPQPRTICLLTFPKAEMLDTVGPLEVFAKANQISERALYRLDLVAPETGPVPMESGLALSVAAGLEQHLGPIDTLLVAGGEGARRQMDDPAVRAWLAARAPRARRLGSICTGAYVLAAAGYLNGRRATTHWASCAELAARFPKVTVEPDAIFVRDGRLITSAGITAGIDLALALVEEDHGRALAFAIARQMVVFARRPGGQSQFSAALQAQAAGGARFDALRAWILEHLAEPLPVARLAARAAMSERSFARHFTKETGYTPARFVELARIDAARQALEEGAEPLEAIARRLGFGHPETLRRLFLKHLSLGPRDYRRRWGQVADTLH
ncbi:MAG: GlxA family transcriptional regulator [Pseudomonadota bacterium]